MLPRFLAESVDTAAGMARLADDEARHLAQVLRTYTRHYNLARPHRSLGLGAPLARDQPVSVGHVGGAVVRHDDLGGLIHEYLPKAA